MLRKLAVVMLTLVFAVCLTACAENEYKTTQKTESQTESEPQDVSPGEMIVE